MHRVAPLGVAGDGNWRDMMTGAAQSASSRGRSSSAEVAVRQFKLDAPDGRRFRPVMR